LVLTSTLGCGGLGLGLTRWMWVAVRAQGQSWDRVRAGVRATVSETTELGDSGVRVGTAGWGTAKASFHRAHARAYRQKVFGKDDAALRASGALKEVRSPPIRFNIPYHCGRILSDSTSPITAWVWPAVVDMLLGVWLIVQLLSPIRSPLVYVLSPLSCSCSSCQPRRARCHSTFTHQTERVQRT
jgi:hypothetical protein